MNHCAACSAAIEPDRTLCPECCQRIHDEGRERALAADRTFDAPFRLERAR